MERGRKTNNAASSGERKITMQVHVRRKQNYVEIMMMIITSVKTYMSASCRSIQFGMKPLG
jgi:hypothetical protein